MTDSREIPAIPYTVTNSNHLKMVAENTDAGELPVKTESVTSVTQSHLIFLSQHKKIGKVTVIRNNKPYADNKRAYQLFITTTPETRLHLQTQRGKPREWKDIARLITWIDEHLPTVKQFEIHLQEQ